MKYLAILLSLFCFLPSASYADMLDWQTTNIQLLRGYDYEIGERQRSIITLEHANGWAYGDTYAWVDFIKPDGVDYTYYGEFSPRLSLSKITGRDLSYGIIKDVLISTTFEKAKDQGPQYLYGAALDLDLPGFKFFKTNAYIHDSTELSGQTWQVTLAWNYPIEHNDNRFLIEGYADFQGDEGTSNANQAIVPRFLFDAGHALGYEKDKLFVGMEYQYWHNKFGRDGVTESVPQAQIKWVF